MAQTKIEWTSRVWNPIRGCSLASHGCTNCYAMKQAHRFSGPGGLYEGLTRLGANGPIWTGEVRAVPEKLDEPLSWRKPARVFVNSMSDLFHEDVPDEFIDRVFAVMNATAHTLPARLDSRRWHTYQVLTKRAERMAAYMESRSTRHWAGGSHPVIRAGRGDDGVLRGHGAEVMNAGAVLMWPPPNVWLGVSVEDQSTADERIPHLLRTPAAVRFLSCEPLLGPIRLTSKGYIAATGDHPEMYGYMVGPDDGETVLYKTREEALARSGLGWAIGGFESGPLARPGHPDWARGLRDQCVAAGVPWFWKQNGEFIHQSQIPSDFYRDRESRGVREHCWPDGSVSFRVGKKAAGRLLDGVEWDQFPEVPALPAAAGEEKP